MRALLLCSVWRLSSPLRISRTPSPSSGPAWRLHPVTTDMVALDKILDLWCNNQRLPTFHTRLTLGSTLHDSGIACQLAQRCRTLMARLSSHSRGYIALFHQPYPPKSTQRLSTFDWLLDWVFDAASATLTTLTVLATLVTRAARSTGCSTRGAATTPTLTLSLFLRVDHCTSDCLAWQRRGNSGLLGDRTNGLHCRQTA